MLKSISKKKSTIKRFLGHINSLEANSWNELVVEETLCSLHTLWIINENYKILTTNDTNIFPSKYPEELLEILLVSSTGDTLPDPSLFLFQ